MIPGFQASINRRQERACPGSVPSKLIPMDPKGDPFSKVDSTGGITKLVRPVSPVGRNDRLAFSTRQGDFLFLFLFSYLFPFGLFLLFLPSFLPPLGKSCILQFTGLERAPLVVGALWDFAMQPNKVRLGLSHLKRDLVDSLSP